MTNSADPDQLDLDLHRLLRQGMSCSAREGLNEHLFRKGVTTDPNCARGVIETMKKNL